MLLKELESIFNGAEDYCIKDDGTTLLAVFPTQPEDIEIRATNIGGVNYTIQQISFAELASHTPCTSLVNGRRYLGNLPQKVSFVSESQLVALKKWLTYHNSSLNDAKAALLSDKVTMASAIFGNQLNGLSKLLIDMNEDWAKGPLAETKPTDLIGDTGISYIRLSAQVELFAVLTKYLNAPMPRTGFTPMQLLTLVN